MEQIRFKKIYVEISNSCNFRCPFCCRSAREKRFLSAEQFSEIAGKIAPFTKHIYLHVLGEPLLHPHLDEILATTKKSGLYVNITTNGSLLPKQESVLRKHTVRQLNVSLHDWETNGGGAENLRQTVRTAIRLAQEMYVCFRLWNISDESAAAFDRTCLTMLKSELGVADIAAKATAGNGITLAPNIFLQQERRFVWPSSGGEETDATRRCRAIRDHIAILSDGRVVPCCLDADGHLALGNIFAQPLDKMLQSERARRMTAAFRTGKAAEPFCRTCGFHIREFGISPC